MNPLRKLLPAALIALGLYLAGAWLSKEFMRSADDVALIWLSAGVGFAIAIIAGRWGLVVVALSALLVHLLIAPVQPLFLLYSVAANTLGAAAAMLAFRLMGGSALSRLTVRTGFVILIGGIALAGTSAAVGTLGLVHVAMVPASNWPSVFMAWALGNLFGVIALTATLLLISTALRRRLGLQDAATVPEPRRHPAEDLAWMLSSLGVLGLVMLAGAASGSQALGLAGLPMAMLLWSAIRFPALLTFIATTVMALVVTMLTGLGIAGFSIPSGAIESAVLVAFLCISMVAPQVLAGAIHENRVAALRLLRRALRDPLTGLPNRAAFDEDLRRALAKPAGRPLLVAYLDLDQFKIINDALSHAAGDALLRELAGLMRALLPADAELYRLGGDEFAVLQPCVQDAEASNLLDSLCERVADFRFAWEAGLISTQVSIGYALSERPAADYGELLAQVDAACFTAKELGGNRVQHAAPGEQAVRERTSAMHWVLRINEALEHDRFELFCQEITPLDGEQDGRHLEILLRKREASTGALLPPAEFIAAAERFGLSARLDTWVVDRTLSWLEDHPQAAASVRLCSINLSTASLVDASFARFLRQRLARSSFPLTRLCFEITETGAVRDLARAVEFISGLRALGCRFALDDFGTGFCSFSYLPKLDVDLLKIDGSFVRDAGTSPLALAIVQAIVRIAQVTGRKTVAEWVETPALVERMRELGLDYVQGYAYSRPQPIADFFAAEGNRESGVANGLKVELPSKA
jgi:diguanylate cyclase (GGDEF)-like protein